MSAYAALVSLLRIHPNSLWNADNRAQLQSIHEKVILLLEFLENSSTQISSTLEIKMREAAYKAESILESQFEQGISLTQIYSLMILCNFPLVVTVYSIIGFIRICATQGFSEVKFMDYIVMYAVCAISSIIGIVTLLINKAFQASNLRALGDSGSQGTNLRLVLNDLDEILVDMNGRIKEARSRSGGGELEMSCYAPLISLRNILDSILDSGIHNRAQLKSLHDKVTFLLDFLGNALSLTDHFTTQKAALQKLDATMNSAASKAKTFVQFQIPAQFILDSDMRSFRRFVKLMNLAVPCVSFSVILSYKLTSENFTPWSSFCFGAFASLTSCAVVWAASYNPELLQLQENEELNLVIDDLSILVNTVIKIKDACGNPSYVPPATSGASSSFRRASGDAGKNVVVGLQNDIQQIQALLLEGSSNLQVISIVGMGGIGKTTLAREVYNVLIHAHYFDVRAWVTLSHECSPRPVLLSLLDSVKILTKQMQKDNEEGLGLHLYQFLCGRRFLIVMDNLWDIEVLEFVRRFLPDDKNGSRVLLTSRLSFVAGHQDDSCRYCHRLQVLNEEDSWELLRKMVFGAHGSCPEELVTIGEEIAKGCRGLPLAIVVIGGVLSQDKHRVFWEEIVEKFKNSQMMQIRKQCLEILGLSYKHLPHHLRPCFLYMAVFSVENEISVSKLISLWAAEGFIKPCISKSLEEVAEDYLKDLIERNLILICKRSCNGKIRTCRIHDLLRDVCVENAHQENFLHVIDSGSYVTRDRDRPDGTPRRLCILLDALQDLPSCCNYVRSFLCIGTSKPIKEDPSVRLLCFLYLRVLDVAVVHFGEFPDQIIKLVHLRYLAFPMIRQNLHSLKSSKN